MAMMHSYVYSGPETIYIFVSEVKDLSCMASLFLWYGLAIPAVVPDCQNWCNQLECSMFNQQILYIREIRTQTKTYCMLFWERPFNLVDM